MGSPTFDRQVFVKKTQTPPPSRSPLPGALALVVVAALASFATYRYVKAGGGVPFNNADKAQIAQLQQKLKAAQARVEELEKRHHVSHVTREVEKAKPLKAKTDATKSSHTLLAENAPHPASHAVDGAEHSTHRAVTASHRPKDPSTAADVHKPLVPASKRATAGTNRLLSRTQQPSNKQLSLLKSDLAANNDQWQATVNRLGNVVGELDTQRNELKKNQSNVNYLMTLAHRTHIPFTLTKGRRFQRIGPVSMRLTDTSVKGQHYDIRLIVDDKSVELKDRALNEVVQFYTSQSQYPLELIVSQINKGEVSGTLAVPHDLGQELSNTQLQEK